MKQTIKELEKRGIISRKPKPIFVFLLFFGYLLIWLVAFTFYSKFNMQALKIPVIAITILTLLTLIYAFIHQYIVKNLTESS